MNRPLSRATALAAAVLLAVALPACGKADRAGVSAGDFSDKDGFKIGLLFPGTQVGRYESFDKPLIEKRIKELCGDCTVEAVSAMAGAPGQRQQVESMITNGVKVLVVNCVDCRAIRSSVENADRANVPVVAYDRLAEGPISGYTSFDGEAVGRIQGEALLEALGDKAENSRIVMMNGAPTDPNAASFEKGALSALKGEVKIGRAYETADWRRENAYTNMSGAIADLGAGNIDGVYAANDTLAAGVISALKSANIDPLPPVTGQDADLEAVRRIITGEQYMSVYKPFKPQADATAEMAVALGRGENLHDIIEDTVSNDTVKDIPAVLFDPIPLTVDDIEDTVVKGGLYTIEEICTPQIRAACEKAGLTG